MKPTLIVLLSLALTTTGLAAPANLIKEAGISGGLVAQVGSDDLALKELGERFHVRLLLPDAATAGKAQAAIEQAGLQGRFTAAAWDGQRLPFAERVLNALVVDREGLVPDAEARRVLAPRGLLITPKGATAMPAPAALDDWTHYLYDASGNAVSKDKEVAPPRSFRWSAPPPHLRSHNYGASSTGLVTAGGRVFHFSDDGTPLFDRGGATERWTLVARDAFNGAFLWKRPLHGYGQPYFEDVSGQAVPDHVWRSPLSLNRRMVAQGKKLYVALNYRAGALSILDGATGQTRHEVELGGSVDEIIASGDRVVCRVRTEIPLPDERLTRDQRLKTEKQLQAEGVPANEVRAELNARRLDHLMGQKLERVVAVDAASGKVLWQHDAPLVAVQSLAMQDGKVVFHNYRAVVALDAASGRPAWEYASPVVNRRRFGVRNLLGNLLLADGKALWASGATGGVCLNLADGRELWKDPRMGETGGFAFPTALRAIRDVLYWDVRRPPVQLADGSHATGPAVGDMLKRGHRIRCFAGKATERFLITPHRGAEFVDLAGDEHTVNDWIRGACSYGLMPANGLIYNTPDPCSCYVGARINGFLAVAATTTRVEAGGPRIEKGPAYSEISDFRSQISEGWPMYRCDGRRTGRAATALSAKLTPQWERAVGELTPATIAGGQVYVARKDTYELLALDAATGATKWRRAFPGALDGPPTIVGDRLFLGCRDGHVYALRAADGVLAWRFRAAPQERLTLCSDRLESVWPVSASVLAHNGLIYAVAGRNSYLDGGLLLYALDPSTGAVKHHRRLDGPWPDREALRKGVAIEGDKKLIQTQHATGYDLDGAQADLLVTDGTDLYLMKHKFTPALSPIPMQRVFHTGLTPMGGKHLLANFGFLDDTMFHRSYWMYDEVWPGYGGGSGWAARAGTMVVVGAQRAYAAKHYEGGWYPTHRPGSGARPAIWQRGGDRAHGGAALGDDRAADRPGHAGRAGRAGRGTRVHRRHRRGQHASRVGQVHRVRRPRQTARPQRRRRPGPRRLRPARLPGLRRHERRRRQDADRVGERPSHLHERKEPLMKKSIIVAAICLLAMALSPRVRAVEPADPNLMPEARRLLDYIVSVQGKGIITGMERTGGGQGPFPAVLHVSGREPAIYGTDIYGYHTKFNETYHGVVKAVVAKSLQWWQDKGGIVEIHYHWGKPTDPNGSAWKNKPKGAKLLDLAKTLTPGTDEYKAFHDDLRVTADYLKQLADAKVPVLWRPFHEIDGGWFWWTDPEKPENTAALYRQMFRYLVKERGLHNLIWVYNAAHVARSSQKPKDAAFADEVAHRKRFYPGGEYVDIASIDAYPNPQLGWNAPWEDARQKAYELMQAIAPGKPLAISEDNGPLNPDSKQCPPWVFDMAWFSMLCPADWTRRAFNHDHMITLDELPLLADRNAAPNVRIERPTDSMAMATADIEVTGFASDRNGNLESVSVHGLSEPWLTCEERDDEAVQKAFAGGKALGEARLGADGRWTFTWNDAPAGYHNLVAIAKDKAGAVSSSNVARVTVRIENLARGKAATASSSGKGGRTPPEAAVDGDLWTSWRADKDAEGPQWLQVDLGAERRVGAVCVTWYKAYAKDYAVQVSADGRTWRDAGKIAGRNKYHGDSDFLRFEPVQARHLRLFCAKPAVTWATYGVWELAVYEGVPR